MISAQVIKLMISAQRTAFGGMPLDKLTISVFIIDKLSFLSILVLQVD